MLHAPPRTCQSLSQPHAPELHTEASRGAGKGIHFFTVDVEEYFQVSAMEDAVPVAAWDRYPSRVERSTDALLALLDRTDSRGTFFTLGWVAERHPALVRRIADAGHEVASHGWWHRRVTTLEPAEFREDVRTSRDILRQVSGQPVEGYRAPTFSIVPGREWALDALLEAGYRYDSSLFPIQRAGYGYAGVPPHAHVIARPGGVLLEIPPTTTMIAGRRVPAAGGGWFRQLPYALTRHAFRESARDGRPGMFYIHPWEVDPEQPRIRVSWLNRVRHYRGLGSTLDRLERLLGEFRFTSVASRLEELLAEAPTVTLPER